MLFFVRFDIRQPDNVSNPDLVAIWQREAAADEHLWKVSGQRVVLAVVDAPSAEDLDRALAGLPIIREMGPGMRTEALPIYEYETFAADLDSGVHGG